MADYSGFLSNIFGLSQMFIGSSIASAGADAAASSIIAAGEVSAQGARLTARGYREAIKSEAAVTTFNLGIDEINTQRRLQATSRGYQRLLGSQTVIAARSGFSATSSSFLQLRSEALNQADKALLNIKLDAENARRAKIFESNIRQTTLENQARAADYQAEAELVLSRNKAAEAAFQGEVAQFKTVQKAIPTLLGGLFGS